MNLLIGRMFLKSHGINLLQGTINIFWDIIFINGFSMILDISEK